MWSRSLRVNWIVATAAPSAQQEFVQNRDQPKAERKLGRFTAKSKVLALYGAETSNPP
jgi:hypothetical protein